MQRPLSALCLIGIVVVVTGCNSATRTVTAGPSAAAGSPAAATPGGSPSPSQVAPAGGADASGTIWLCFPGSADDPCTSDLAATVVKPDGSSVREDATPAADPPIDCFYVYPTVSTELGPNADLSVGPEERAVAVAQASRFSQVCRVYAPMYLQLTLAAIARPRTLTADEVLLAYQGVEAAFRDYLANDNNGRGIVFIGHSQGASMLIALLKMVVDPDPALRQLLVSALLMGGNPTVPAGATVGGDFQNIPTCGSAEQTGCLVAYSSFEQEPPADALFGRPGAGFSALRPQASGASLQVVCVNPAAVGGGSGSLQPYFPTGRLVTSLSGGPGLPTDTPWVALPDEYTAHCQTADGATWLQVDDARAPGDTRPVVSQTLGPTWGLHLVDVNIALGNLVDLVRAEASGFQP